MRPKLVILDRDGVINHDSDSYVKSADEWQPIAGSIEAIGRLCRHGYQVAVASNQSGLGRGLFDQAALDAMHAKMERLIAAEGGTLAAIRYCAHGPDAGCDCRKPAPGLLLEIGQLLGLPLDGVPFIGDTLKDVEAARAVNCRPMLVRTGKGERTLMQHPELAATLPVFADLAAAVDDLLNTPA